MPQQKTPPVFPPRVPKVTRPSQSKAAIAERKLPPEWYYLSFASDDAFLGAIVWASSKTDAIKQAAKLGIAPGGDGLVWTVVRKHLRKIQLDPVNRLIGETELRRRNARQMKAMDKGGETAMKGDKLTDEGRRQWIERS